MRAKFKVENITITRYAGSEIRTVKLIPVSSGSPENEKFFQLTPFGSIEVGTINLAAVAEFEPGKEFYIDFTAA